MTDDLKAKGSLLKEAREARGIGLEKIHEDTKIPIDALRALEEGYTVRSMSGFYQRGFLKIYAQYLNLDWKKIEGDPSPVHLPDTLTSLKTGREKSAPSLTMIPGKFERGLPWVKILGLVLAVFVLWKTIGGTIHAIRSRSSNRAHPKASQPHKTKTPKPKETKSLLPAQNSVLPPESTATATHPSGAVVSGFEEKNLKKNVTLSVRAKKNSWLMVKTDGQVVFQAVFKKGVTKTWFADKEIELSGKNINQLDWEVNGKMIGALGKEGHGAKRVVVTKNGLAVKK